MMVSPYCIKQLSLTQHGSGKGSPQMFTFLEATDSPYQNVGRDAGTPKHLVCQTPSGLF